MYQFSKKGGEDVRLGHAGKRKSYLTTVIVVVMGYLLFFTSTLWYPGQRDAEDYTPIGQMQEVKETGNGVTIVYWAYSPEQSAMSVELDINAVDRDISFAAVDKKRREIPVTLKISQSGTYVLELDSIQEDFQAVSLRVTIQGKTIRLYTNNKQVDKVEKLIFYSDLDGYYQARVSRNILSLEQEIQETKEQIRSLQEQIESCEGQLAQTKERLPYLSKQQRVDAEKTITAWKTQIETYQSQQKEAQEHIVELMDEIEKQKKMISSENDSESEGEK